MRRPSLEGLTPTFSSMSEFAGIKHSSGRSTTFSTTMASSFFRLLVFALIGSTRILSGMNFSRTSPRPAVPNVDAWPGVSS